MLMLHLPFGSVYDFTYHHHSSLPSSSIDSPLFVSSLRVYIIE